MDTVQLPEAATAPPDVQDQRSNATTIDPAVGGAQCPVHPWCIEDGDHTWHNSEPVTVHVECGLDKTHNHGHNRTPYIDARLISEDDPSTGIRGARAAVSLDDCEVDAAGARREVAKLRAALPRIETLADILDGKPPTPPVAAAARRWTITTESGAKVSGHLPAWAEKDPSETVRDDRLQISLSDLTHWTCFDGQTVPLDAPGFDKDRYTGPSEILRGSIDCRPYATDPAERVPLVNVELTDDHWINNLDPEGVADLAAKLRAQAERLTNEVLPALLAAREDWTKNGGRQ
jgi:hypothetical protein